MAIWCGIAVVVVIGVGLGVVLAGLSAMMSDPERYDW
jgi:hypothetical protein